MKQGDTIRNKNPYVGEPDYLIEKEVWQGEYWRCICKPGAKYDTANMLIEKKHASQYYTVINPVHVSD